jgi:hypothetical protein
MTFKRYLTESHTFLGSAVTFGSIDDAAAPISSSPASVPPIKSEGVKSFGSVPATNSSTVNGKTSSSFASSQAGPSSSRQSSISMSSSPVIPKAPIPVVSKQTSASPSSSSVPGPSPTPTPKPNRVDIRKLFQNPSTTAPPPSSSNSDTSSPALRPTTLPSTSTHAPTTSQSGQFSQPSQPVSSYTSFVPSAGFRQTTSANPSASTSRPSPYLRQMTNGTSGGVGVGNRQSSGPGAQGAPQNMQTGMHSPRSGPPPHGGQPPAGLPPTQSYYPQYYVNISCDFSVMVIDSFLDSTLLILFLQSITCSISNGSDNIQCSHHSITLRRVLQDLTLHRYQCLPEILPHSYNLERRHKHKPSQTPHILHPRHLQHILSLILTQVVYHHRHQHRPHRLDLRSHLVREGQPEQTGLV